MTDLVFARLNRRTALRRLPTLAFAAIALAGITLSATATPSQAEGLKDIKASGYATAVTEDDFNPFEFMEDGVSNGYDNDLLAEVTEEAAVQGQTADPAVVRHPARRHDRQIRHRRDRRSGDRRAQAAFEFSSPVAQSTTYFATKAGSSIKKGSDLNGKTVGVQAGSAMLAELKTFDASLKAKGGAGLKKIVEYPSNPEAYQDLALGRTDAVVNTEINLRSLVKEKPASSRSAKALPSRSTSPGR